MNAPHWSENSGPWLDPQPTIQTRRPLFTSAARRYADRTRDALNYLTKADRLINDEPGQPDMMPYNRPGIPSIRAARFALSLLDHPFILTPLTASEKKSAGKSDPPLSLDPPRKWVSVQAC